MKKAPLIDEQLEAELCQNGFVVIKEFIEIQQVDQLLRLYQQYHPVNDKENGMWNSLFNVGFENGLKISKQILKILKPQLESIFKYYYAPVGTFMSKNSNKNSSCHLHRDFSTADESQFQYRNIWIPLVQTTPHNGALYVVKGSNNVFDYILPMFSEWPYKFMQEELIKSAQTVNCHAGDLVIYLDKTLHGSHINNSQESRPAVHFGVLHPDVQLLFYYLNTITNKVRTFEVPFEFYLENNFEEPTDRFPLYSEHDYNPPALNMQEVMQKLLA